MLVMTQPPLRPPSRLLLRPKAAPTSSGTSLDALVTKTPPHLSRESSRSRQASPLQALPTTDVSEKATAALIRRVLVPSSHGGIDASPIDQLLPPLTSSNAVDLQLYAIIAVIIKEFVASWYTKITPDQGFVEEAVRIIAHCTRALEQRIRSVDIESLVLDEIPELVESHISAYRASHESPHSPPFAAEARVVYHNLIPHPAFSPVPLIDSPSTVHEQLNNEAAYRQLLVQGVLAVLLPTEDLGNACLRTLVADIIGEMILGNGVGGKACEGWLIWEGMTKIVENVKARVGAKATGEEIEVDTRSRLEKFGLLTETKEEFKLKAHQSRSSVVSEIFWRLLQYGYLAFITVRFIILGLATASSRPPRSPTVSGTTGPEDIQDLSAIQKTVKRPILSYKIFSLIGLLLDLSDRMPWLSGSLCLAQYHATNSLRVGATDGLFDKFLHQLLTAHVLSPSLIPSLLKTVRTSLFPGNTLTPARIVPSSVQKNAIKRSCAVTILEHVPRIVMERFLLGSSNVSSILSVPSDDISRTTDENLKEEMIMEIESVLDIFGDSYCNKHLVFGIIELCIVRLIPEIGEKGVADLLDARLGEGWE